MGMTLVPSTADVDDFTITYPRWGWLRNLLDSLGCDTSEMRDYNDGDEIGAATLMAWGDTIAGALERDELAYVTRGPNALADVPSLMGAVAAMFPNEPGASVVPRLARLIRRTSPGGVPPTQNDMGFMRAFVQWVRTAGGCSQW